MSVNTISNTGAMNNQCRFMKSLYTVQKLQFFVVQLPLALLDCTSLKKPYIIIIIAELKEHIADEIKATDGTLLQRVMDNF
jgi:hypothetical protein